MASYFFFFPRLLPDSFSHPAPGLFLSQDARCLLSERSSVLDKITLQCFLSTGPSYLSLEDFS